MHVSRRCLAAVSLVAGLTAGGQERTTTDVTVSYSYIRAKPATRSSTDFNMQGAREFTRRASAESLRLRKVSSAWRTRPVAQRSAFLARETPLSLRLGEVDYLMTNFREVPGVGRQVQNNLRVSTGLKFHF